MTKLGEEIERLRLEAASALGSDPRVLDAVLLAFEDSLEAYAEGWRSYIRALEPEYLPEFFELERSPLDEVHRAVGHLLEAALRGGHSEASFALAYFPVNITVKAVRWGAPAYFRLLSLYPLLYSLSHRISPDEDRARIFKERAWWHPVEAIELMLPSVSPPRLPGDAVTSGLAIRARDALGNCLVEVLRLCVKEGDTANFQEGLRRWRIAERQRDREASSDEARAGASLPVPLLFEVIRQFRHAKLTDLRWWLDQITQSHPLHVVSRAIEDQLSGDQPLISRWVEEELPSHEAHFIDTKSHLLGALVYVGLIRTDARAAEPPAVVVGPSLRSQLDAFDRLAEEAASDGDRLAIALKIDEVPARVERLKAAMAAAAASFDRARRDRVRATPIDAKAADMVRDALEREWSSGFPRRLLQDLECVTEVAAGEQPAKKLIIRRLELKEFFIEGEANDSSLQMIGEGWANAFLRGETAAIAEQLERARRYSWGRRSLSERLNRGVSTLRGRGLTATHVWGPLEWEYLERLAQDGTFQWAHGQAKLGEVGTFVNLPLYQSEAISDFYVLSLPQAIRVDQYLMADGRAFAVLISEIDEAQLASLRAEGIADVEGDEADTAEERIKMRALIDIRESPVFVTDATAFVRVSALDPRSPGG